MERHGLAELSGLVIRFRFQVFVKSRKSRLRLFQVQPTNPEAEFGFDPLRVQLLSLDEAIRRVFPLALLLQADSQVIDRCRMAGRELEEAVIALGRLLELCEFAE